MRPASLVLDDETTTERELEPTTPDRERLTALPIRARPELAQVFDEEHVQGGIALFDASTQELSASDPELAKRAYSPALTFNVAQSAMALELGVLDNPDSPMPGDGEFVPDPRWDGSLTLRTAIQVSCVPCFQRVTHLIGSDRMNDWLRRFDYGNRDSSGMLGMFWLSGKLRITAIQQLDFLRRLDEGKLPISTRTLDIVRDVIALDVSLSHVLYGKTGASGAEDGDEVDWFVGFVTVEEKTVYFATLITGHAQGVDVNAQQRRVTERVLRSLGALPVGRSPLT